MLHPLRSILRGTTLILALALLQACAATSSQATLDTTAGFDAAALERTYELKEIQGSADALAGISDETPASPATAKAIRVSQVARNARNAASAMKEMARNASATAHVARNGEGDSSAQRAASQDFASAIDDSELDDYRGAFSPEVLTFNQLEGVSTGNSAIGNTGANQIDAGAFDNTTGLVNVIQNSGNNNVIQSSTILNVTFND